MQVDRRVTASRPGPRPEPPEDVLGQACALVRLCGQDAAIAAVLLALVLIGTGTRLAAGPPGLAALALLPVLAGVFATSAVFAVRSRLTLVSVLGEVRGRLGAPLDPGVPWTTFASAAALDGAVRDRELRRLLSAAHRCGELSWRALAWAVTAAVLFLFWSLAAAAGGG
ncbi:hypothetical protein [Actinomadura algeriensis]|uniref:Integral membrane plasmid transfer protein n=1 Tax=Actinomadura algeriensis TaxID=1679523 RepID=A0ABR9K1T4_9ACTN|nr:hypothetical protein [Actinomadura algeriensis]MBE1536506.1 hypothetical protein [Actinomadura algeriensis]